MDIIIGFVISCISLVIGAFMNDWFTTKRNKKESLREIVNEFKVSFAIEPANFLGGSNKKEIFARTFSAYHTSCVKAWLVIPESHQRKLQKAWDEYRGKGYKPHEDLEWFTLEQIFNAESESPDDSGEVVEYKKRLKNLHSCLDDLL